MLWCTPPGATIPSGMWPFKAQGDVSELLERVSTLERRVKALMIDGDDLFDRFKRLSGKIAKRGEREDAEASPSDEGAQETGLTGAALSPSFSRLTPHQKKIQMQIMMRRNTNGGNA